MGTPTARVSRVIHARPDEIWKALTTRELIKQYFLGADVESDFKPGSPIRWRGEFKGKAYEDKGEIREVEPKRRLVFSHFSPLTGAPDRPENYHLVQFDLAAKGDDTEVTLTQSNLDGGTKPGEEQQRAEYEKNWSTLLAGLSKTVEH